MIIDAHQHFWQIARGDYDWLTPDLTPLYRDFLPDDLTPLLTHTNVDGTVLVQAAPTIEETDYMLRLADDAPFVLGVVGWVDFDDWMLRQNLTPAFDAMIAHDLTFDALVLPRHLPRLAQLLQRHPNLRTIVDHGAKPNIADGQFDVWAGDIANITQTTTAYCKLSGLLTEAGDDWSKADITPYIDHLLAVFGPDRLIWGSDWPVLTLASDYASWFNLAQSMFDNTSSKNAVFGANARTAYRLRIGN